MAGYRKYIFDQCLGAIVAELGRSEEQQPQWPANVVQGAEIISEKANALLKASIELDSVKGDNRKRLLEEAVATGAMALRFLLTVDDGYRYGAETRE